MRSTASPPTPRRRSASSRSGRRARGRSPPWRATSSATEERAAESWRRPSWMRPATASRKSSTCTIPRRRSRTRSWRWRKRSTTRTRSRGRRTRGGSSGRSRSRAGGNLPVCMAKTHLSISDKAFRKGRPSGYTFTVSDVRASVGAGFIYPISGSIVTMPGLPGSPRKLDVDEQGKHHRPVGRGPVRLCVSSSTSFRPVWRLPLCSTG